MSRITPDESTLAQLVGIHDQAEICDSQGSVIGYFQPVSNSTTKTYYEPTVSKEELEQYEQEPGGKTLSEIFAGWLKRK